MGRVQTELSHSFPQLSEKLTVILPFCFSVILPASIFSDKFFISHLTCLLRGGIGWSRRYCASHTFQQNREKTKQNSKIIKIVACILLIQILVISAFVVTQNMMIHFTVQAANRVHIPHTFLNVVQYTLLYNSFETCIHSHHPSPTHPFSQGKAASWLKWIFSFKCNLCLNQN